MVRGAARVAAAWSALRTSTYDTICLVAGCSPPARRLQLIAANWLCGRSVESWTSPPLFLAGRAVQWSARPGGFKRKLGTEVDEVTDEVERFVALRIDRQNEATRELEDTRLAGHGMVRPSPVTCADQGKAPVGILGNVSRPGGVVRDALPVSEFLRMALPWGNASIRRTLPSSLTHVILWTKPVS
jgi:hypothetical protein